MTDNCNHFLYIYSPCLFTHVWTKGSGTVSVACSVGFGKDYGVGSIDILQACDQPEDPKFSLQ